AACDFAEPPLVTASAVAASPSTTTIHTSLFLIGPPWVFRGGAPSLRQWQQRDPGGHPLDPGAGRAGQSARSDRLVSRREPEPAPSPPPLPAAPAAACRQANRTNREGGSRSRDGTRRPNVQGRRGSSGRTRETAARSRSC